MNQHLSGQMNKFIQNLFISQSCPQIVIHSGGVKLILYNSSFNMGVTTLKRKTRLAEINAEALRI